MQHQYNHDFISGGWPTPLKNDGLRQEGWHPIYEIENNSSKPPTRFPLEWHSFDGYHVSDAVPPCLGFQDGSDHDPLSLLHLLLLRLLFLHLLEIVLLGQKITQIRHRNLADLDPFLKETEEKNNVSFSKIMEFGSERCLRKFENKFLTSSLLCCKSS